MSQTLDLNLRLSLSLAPRQAGSMQLFEEERYARFPEGHSLRLGAR
jgi:hypothetical protein